MTATRAAGKAGALGFVPATDNGARESSEKIEKALKKTFRPEFLNRIDEIIIFSQLKPEDVQVIVDLQMHELGERLAERGLTVVLTAAARVWLAQQGYDPAYGARPMRRALQKYLESPLSTRLLRGEFKSGDRVRIDVVDDHLDFILLESGPVPQKAVEELAEHA